MLVLLLVVIALPFTVSAKEERRNSDRLCDTVIKHIGFIGEDFRFGVDKKGDKLSFRADKEGIIRIVKIAYLTGVPICLEWDYYNDYYFATRIETN